MEIIGVVLAWVGLGLMFVAYIMASRRADRAEKRLEDFMRSIGRPGE